MDNPDFIVCGCMEKIHWSEKSLRFVIVVFPDHTYLPFLKSNDRAIDIMEQILS